MDGFLSMIGYGNIIIVLGVLIFVHELGHYWVAKRCFVWVRVFSIGFGPEIVGWTDSWGTRWKISLIPLGGYVSMFGEGMTDKKEIEQLSDKAHKYSFAHKTLGQRTAIVAAGPLANFLFAIIAFAALLMTVGQPIPGDFIRDGIGDVAPGSAAEQAGFQSGDRILRIDGKTIPDFEALATAVRGSEGRELTFDIDRNGKAQTLRATPRPVQVGEGENRQTIYQLGVTLPTAGYERLGLSESLWRATVQTGQITALMVREVGKLLTGQGKMDDMGGPVKIAQISNDAGKAGWIVLVNFMAFLSINLGLLNLFPIPVLDGGHLVFFAMEALMGRPVSLAIRMRATQIGMGLLLALMVFLTFNDIINF